MDKISSPNRQKKEKIVAKLSEKISRAKGLVFANYQGLTHKQIEGIKKKLKPLDADFSITKNTLLKISLKDSSFAGKIESEFKDPTATVFLYGDPVEPLRQLAKTIKELNLPSIKIGIIEGQLLSSAQVLKMSTLPSRWILLAMVVSGIKSPIFGLHRSLIWNIQKLAFALKAIEGRKEFLK